MKFCLLYIFSVFITVLFLTGCSELETNISQPQQLTVHKEGISLPGHANFHGKLIRDNGWDMKQCQTCHAADFSGGVANASCSNCHTAPAGPEACNTCHGSFANPSRIAPPTDLDNNISTSEQGVGFHSKHLYETTIGNAARCGSCHQFPQSLYAEGHMDPDGRAEVILKNIATAFGASNASYDPADGSCSNIYCHGNFEFHKDSASTENKFAYTGEKMTGTPNTVKWTAATGDEIKCGSCHGLPPVGHIQVPLTSCYSCHQGVVDEMGNIIDKTLHINGVVNARGN